MREGKEEELEIEEQTTELLSLTVLLATVALPLLTRSERRPVRGSDSPVFS